MSFIFVPLGPLCTFVKTTWAYLQEPHYFIRFQNAILRKPFYLLHFRHLWPTRVVHKPARVSPEGVTNFSKISSSAPMGSQICPSGSEKCAKWAQGYENDTQSGPKRAQMVLKGGQSGPKVVPTVASRASKSTKNNKNNDV